MKSSIALWKVTLLISLFITLFGNFSFWSQLTDRISVIDEPFILICFFVIILMLTNILLTLVSFKPVFKIIAILLLLTSASSAYFMDNYAVMIDKDMIRNVLATDFHETKELLSFRLLVTLLVLGILPSWLILKVNINYPPLLKNLLQKTLIGLVCAGIIVTTLYSHYQDLSFFGRNNRELRHLINPENYITSLKSIINLQFEDRNIAVKPIENDAIKMPSNGIKRKPSLVILVLGETARSMNFSLNGYQRNTNPSLAQQDIINFNDVSSCGTATAVSVPCMFSKFSRKNFDYSKGKQYENLLDVAKHAGYQVHWLDNNTGCQGICDRITYESLAYEKNPQFCKDDNCIDEILLQNLQQVVNKDTGDKLIILHQKGNHGPTYHLRYPKEFEVFKPACKTNQLRSCSKKEIVNAYDNAILYSDYFISQTIDFLNENSDEYDTAMAYMSDHGESLGENNLYLHGLPYIIAPEEQKKVPFILWLSDSYQQNYNIDKSCLAKKSSAKLSHDNLFSSMLGLLAIQTQVHDDKLDMFSSCNKMKIAKK